jgi:hypothetical protein
VTIHNKGVQFFKTIKCFCMVIFYSKLRLCGNNKILSWGKGGGAKL